MVILSKSQLFEISLDWRCALFINTSLGPDLTISDAFGRPGARNWRWARVFLGLIWQRRFASDETKLPIGTDKYTAPRLKMRFWLPEGVRNRKVGTFRRSD